jgi:hypothetical protein
VIRCVDLVQRNFALYFPFVFVLSRLLLVLDVVVVVVFVFACTLFSTRNDDDNDNFILNDSRLNETFPSTCRRTIVSFFSAALSLSLSTSLSPCLFSGL